MTKILFNTNAIRSRNTGIGKYTQGLLDGLQKIEGPKLEIITHGNLQKQRSEVDPQKNSALLGFVRDHVPFAYSARRFLEQRQFNETVRRSQPDIYHEPTLWPFSFSGPTVITVHDLSHLRFPETQPKNRLKEINKRFDQAITQAQKVLVDSRFIQQELVSHYPELTDKITVAPLGCSPSLHQHNPVQFDKTLRKYGLAENTYFIFVGTLEPRKRLPLAIASHQALPIAVRKRF
ncbi:MAG: glycosyltransferase, partial [Pseudomonadales bacterium]|nr:glycosyltransferase [Pseudomonadales bacterium]